MKQKEVPKRYSDACINTNMSMPDLDLLIKLKREAKYTILALEKILED
jgi:hypothetical protein